MKRGWLTEICEAEIYMSLSSPLNWNDRLLSFLKEVIICIVPELHTKSQLISILTHGIDGWKIPDLPAQRYEVPDSCNRLIHFQVPENVEKIKYPFITLTKRIIGYVSQNKQ